MTITNKRPFCSAKPAVTLRNMQQCQKAEKLFNDRMIISLLSGSFSLHQLLRCAFPLCCLRSMREPHIPEKSDSFRVIIFPNILPVLKLFQSIKFDIV